MPHAVAELGRDARGDDDTVLLRKVQLGHGAERLEEVGIVLLRPRGKAVLCRRGEHHAVKHRDIRDIAQPDSHAVALRAADVIALCFIIVGQKRLRREALQVEHIAHARLEQGKIARLIDGKAQTAHLVQKRRVRLLQHRVDADHIVAALLGQRAHGVHKRLERGVVAVAEDRPARRIKEACVHMADAVLQNGHGADDLALLVAAEDAGPAPSLLHAAPCRGLHEMAVWLPEDKGVQLRRLIDGHIFDHGTFLSAPAPAGARIRIGNLTHFTTGGTLRQLPNEPSAIAIPGAAPCRKP